MVMIIFVQQRSKKSDSEPQHLRTSILVSASHEFTHTSCRDATKGPDDDADDDDDDDQDDYDNFGGHDDEDGDDQNNYTSCWEAHERPEDDYDDFNDFDNCGCQKCKTMILWEMMVYS